jgi:hypothetical protein
MRLKQKTKAAIFPLRGETGEQSAEFSVEIARFVRASACAWYPFGIQTLKLFNNIIN